MAPRTAGDFGRGGGILGWGWGWSGIQLRVFFAAFVNIRSKCLRRVGLDFGVEGLEISGRVQ